jgi:histidinol-phosphate aminotransferase
MLVGREQWLTHFEKLRLPYNIGVITQSIAERVLQHHEILLRQADAIRAERAVMIEQLLAIGGIHAFPTDANFILFRVNEATQVFERLKQRGVLIKNLNGSHPLLKNCLRVTVGTPGENACFLDMLKASLAEFETASRLPS